MPPLHLAKFEKAYGRPCPRVDLDAANMALAPIAMLALQPETYGWAVPLALQTAPLIGESRRSALWRIIGAINHEDVTALVERKREQEIEKAKAKAASQSRR